MNYNLLKEQWIPILRENGNPDRVSIIEALTQAGRIRQIAASNPMDRVAILRFLLALLYWCEGKRPDQIPDGSFPATWFNILEEKKECFDLFEEKQSFYQDPKAEGGAVPATKLLHDLPSGTNIAHFRHLRDFRDGLCPACCAMGLLRWAVFASASKKGPKEQMTASLHGNTPAYTVRYGANLFETLWLNWPHGQSLAGDAPRWEGATESSPLGILKNLTWQSRRVLLAAPYVHGHRDFSVGTCCYCSHRTDRLVKSILFRPGWQRPSKGPWWKDPHLFWVTAKDDKGNEKPLVPRSAGPDDHLEAHASVWQSVLQGLLSRSDPSHPSAGQYHTTLVGASQELYKDARTHISDIPQLQQPTVKTFKDEEDWLKRLTWPIASGRTKDWHKRPKGHGVIDALCSTAAKGQVIRSSLCAASFLAESKLEQAFAKLTKGLASADPNDAVHYAKVLQQWRDEVSRILCQHIEQVAGLTTRGSPLRKREAKDRAAAAVLKAESRLSIQKEDAQQ